MRTLLILSLVLMAYDDFKTRSVSLVELCFFGICILFYSIRASGWTHMLNNAVCNIVAGVLMLVTHNNEWVLCLTIAAIIELYTAFRIPNELEKEK